jgi:RHS repeat-associated protein
LVFNAGQALTTTDANANVSQMTYDGTGNLASRTDALGHVTTYGGYDSVGNVGWMLDPNGLETLLTYDTMQHIVEIQRGCDPSVAPDCHWESTIINYTPTGDIDSLFGPDQNGLAYHYDTAHRRTSMDLLVNRYSVNGTVVFNLSESGEILGKTYQDASGNPLQSKTFNYDNLSRLTDAIDSRSNDASQTWDAQGNLITTSDPLGNSTTRTYDALDRLVSSQLPDASTESISYGPDDTVTAQTDAKGHSTSTTYNGFGEPVARTSPNYASGSQDTYTRDANGNMLSVSGPTTLVYTYDALNRPLTKGQPNAAGNFSLVYDTCTNGVGHLCSIGNDTQSVSFVYDRWGRLAGKAQTHQGITLSLGYGYNTQGQLTSMVYPSGSTLLQYWSQGQVYAQMWDDQYTMAYASYDALGNPLSFIWPNGNTFNLTWDQDGHLSSTTAPDYSQTYTYDAASRLSRQADQPSGYSMVYQYDSRNRLTLGGRWGGYAYDANGNRQTWSNFFSPRAYGYDANSDILLTMNNQPFTSDSGGKLTSAPGISAITYDQFNRMSSTTGALGTTSYAYNGLDERISKASPNAGTAYHYLYSEVGHLIGVYDATGAPLEEYTYLGERPIATVRSGMVYSIETDQLMAPIRVLDSNDAVVWTWTDREAFGASSPSAGTVNGAPFTMGLRFPGQYADPETGLVSNGLRDYAPILGRYIEPDPTGLTAGMNEYSYVKDNASNYIDAWGLDLTDPQKIAVSTAAKDWSSSHVPYVLGGDTKNGADCSGAVSSIYRQAGINIGRMTSGAFKNSPLFSPANGDPQIGDIGVYPGHVDIYGGNTGPGEDVWSAHHTGGPVFGPANSSWFGSPTWYRYNNPK